MCAASRQQPASAALTFVPPKATDICGSGAFRGRHNSLFVCSPSRRPRTGHRPGTEGGLARPSGGGGPPRVKVSWAGNGRRRSAGSDVTITGRCWDDGGSPNPTHRPAQPSACRRIRCQSSVTQRYVWYVQHIQSGGGALCPQPCDYHSFMLTAAIVPACIRQHD